MNELEGGSESNLYGLPSTWMMVCPCVRVWLLIMATSFDKNAITMMHTTDRRSNSQR